MTLQDKIDELEQALTANDEEMQKLDAANTELTKKVMTLKAQVAALTADMQQRMRVAHRGPPIVVGQGINEPEFYFQSYEHASKEEVLLALMRAESLLYRHAIIRKAGTPWLHL